MIYSPWCFLIVEVSNLGSDEGYSRVVLLHLSLKIVSLNLDP